MQNSFADSKLFLKSVRILKNQVYFISSLSLAKNVVEFVSKSDSNIDE